MKSFKSVQWVGHAVVALCAVSLASPSHAALAVAPATHTSITGSGGFNTLIRGGVGNDRVHQVIWSAAALSAAGLSVGDTITGLSYRMSSASAQFGANPWPGVNITFPDYDIFMGVAANAPTAMSLTYASNYSGGATQVRDGALNMAAGSFQNQYATPPVAGSAANTFGALIGLSTGYVYTGGDLVIESRVTASTSFDPLVASGFLDSQSDVASGAGANGYRTVASAGLASTAGTFAFSGTAITQFTFTPVPGPASVALLGLAALIAGPRRRRA